jgi:hypothetical protein
MRHILDLLVVWIVYTFAVTVVSLPIWAALILVGGVSPWAMAIMPVASLFAIYGLLNQYGKGKED